MDYFFAQIEEKRRPMASDKIIVVCVFSGRTEDSGVVSTVNYLGRSVGIKSGMPIAFAKKRAPPADSIFIPMDRPYYNEISAQIDSIIRENFEKIVQASVDEWNVDDPKSGEKAAELKNEILRETNLTCTIGVAPSLLGAKMVAAKVKPNGLIIINEEEEKKLIENSALEKVPGIGPKTTETLRLMGAEKVSDLPKLDRLRLVEVFGRKMGGWLSELGSGRYPSELGEDKDQDEISRIGTLKEKTRDQYMIKSKLKELEKEAKSWLIERKKSYRTLAIIFITEDLKTHTKSLSFRNPKGWSEDIEKEKETLVSEFLFENQMEIRRVGIRFGNFMDLGGQTTLF